MVTDGVTQRSSYILDIKRIRSNAAASNGVLPNVHYQSKYIQSKNAKSIPVENNPLKLSL